MKGESKGEATLRSTGGCRSGVWDSQVLLKFQKSFNVFFLAENKTKMSDNNQENINENNFDQSIKKEKKSKKDKKEKKEKKERKRRQRELEMLEKKPETATTNVNDQANDKTINDDGLKDKIPSSDNSEKSTDDLQNDTTRTNSSVKFKNQENSDKSDDSAKAASSTDEKKDTSKSAGEIDKAKSETRIDIPVER